MCTVAKRSPRRKEVVFPQTGRARGLTAAGSHLGSRSSANLVCAGDPQTWWLREGRFQARTYPGSS